MSSMSFKATPQDISQAATNCDQTADTIQGQLASLRQYVVNLEGSWQGVASNTFQDLMSEYDRCSNDLYNALTQIANGLRGNWGNYLQNEQANLAAIQSIDQSLPPGSTPQTFPSIVNPPGSSTPGANLS
jgi:WXG100 family type VII secretion target